MIYYRRQYLPTPLKAIAWRMSLDPDTGRGRLVVVVSEELSAKEARAEALAAVRKLPRHERPKLVPAMVLPAVLMLVLLMHGRLRWAAATAVAVLAPAAGVLGLPFGNGEGRVGGEGSVAAPRPRRTTSQPAVPPASTATTKTAAPKSPRHTSAPQSTVQRPAEGASSSARAVPPPEPAPVVPLPKPTTSPPAAEPPAPPSSVPPSRSGPPGPPGPSPTCVVLVDLVKVCLRVAA